MDRETAMKRLGELLDEIDAQTRLPGEAPLREVVAQHARHQLRLLGEDEDFWAPSSQKTEDS